MQLSDFITSILSRGNKGKKAACPTTRRRHIYGRYIIISVAILTVAPAVQDRPLFWLSFSSQYSILSVSFQVCFLLYIFSTVFSMNFANIT